MDNTSDYTLSSIRREYDEHVLESIRHQNATTWVNTEKQLRQEIAHLKESIRSLDAKITEYEAQLASKDAECQRHLAQIPETKQPPSSDHVKTHFQARAAMFNFIGLPFANYNSPLEYLSLFKKCALAFRTNRQARTNAEWFICLGLLCKLAPEKKEWLRAFDAEVWKRGTDVDLLTFAYLEETMQLGIGDKIPLLLDQCH